MEPGEAMRLDGTHLAWMAEGLSHAFREGDATQSPVYREVVRHLPERGSVLDVGAGVGRLAIPLAQAGHRVIAVEPAAPMRERLASHLQEFGVADRVSVIAQAWPTAAPPVEVAVAAFVLQFAEDPVGFVRAMERVARRRVVLALHVDPLPTAELRALLFGQPVERQHPPRFHDLYPQLAAAGIAAEVTIAEDDHHAPWTDPDRVEAWARRVAGVADEDRLRQVKALVAEKLTSGAWPRRRRTAVLSWTPPG